MMAPSVQPMMLGMGKGPWLKVLDKGEMEGRARYHLEICKDREARVDRMNPETFRQAITDAEAATRAAQAALEWVLLMPPGLTLVVER